MGSKERIVKLIQDLEDLACGEIAALESLGFEPDVVGPEDAELENPQIHAGRIEIALEHADRLMSLLGAAALLLDTK